MGQFGDWRGVSLVVAGLLLCGFRLPLVETDALSAVFVSEAERIDYASPLIASLEVSTPITEIVQLPELLGRFQGFERVEDFEAGRTEAAGRARTVWRFRLTPSGSGPWRLRPFVLTVRDTRTGKSRELLTAPLTFPTPEPLPEAEGAPECDLEPEWVAPGWRTLSLWGLYGAGGIALLVAVLPLLRRIRRTLHERTLAPEVRAELELERLLAEGYLAQGQIKRFYFGLTGVVRRYIERACALRATRQTSQEFLAGLMADPRFTPAEREALEVFLSAADRVKFAGVRASVEEATASTAVTRTLIADHARRARERQGERPQA